MPIQMQNLDDRTFADLVAEGVRMIPGYAPSWTDHNPSDPGITFIELFASVTEQLIYRLNRVSDDSKRAFLKLLTGQDAKDVQSPDDALSQAIRSLSVERRAVIRADFEALAAVVPGVAHVHCLPRRNLRVEDAASPSADVPGYVSLVVIPSFTPAEDTQAAADSLGDRVQQEVLLHCLASTRLTVCVLNRGHPWRVRIGVRMRLTIFADRYRADVLQAATGALQRFLDPITGKDGGGWPPGRAVYLSDIYALMDAVPGVDYVEAGSIELRRSSADTADPRLPPGADSQSAFGLSLAPCEVAEFDPMASVIVPVPGHSEEST